MIDQFKVPELSKEARRAAFDSWKRGYSPIRSAEEALKVDVPGVVRAEVERFAGALMPLGSAQGERMEAYLAARFPEPENAKTVCGMGDDNCRDGVTACTRGKGHPGNHYSVHADRSWPTPSAPAESAEERVLASLAKAYPYLVKHADHIDGEFSNALAELRRMLAGKKPEAAKTVAAVLNERLEPGATEGHFLPRISDGLVPNPGHITPAERDFLRALAADELTRAKTCDCKTEECVDVRLRNAARRVVEEAK